ncbi:uncharacterized protein ACRADG_009542 [Cochliomyia hominivorax]
MNAFATIMCFALVATAAAKPAYNYQQPKQVIKQTFRPPPPPVSNSGIYSVQQAPPLASFSVQSQPQPVKQNFVPAPAPVPVPAPAPAPAPQFTSHPVEVAAPPAQLLQQQFVPPPPPQFTPPAPQFAPPANQFVPPPPQNVAPVQPQTSYAPAAPAVSSSNYNYQPHQQQTIVSKDIYIHSAPEEIEEVGVNQGVEAGPLRKNYRIVFIKAPTHNLKLNLNSLKRAQAQNEEKTVIYVLSKKPDLGNLQSQLAAVQTEQKAHKPEVYFIKYKTQEEANRAQQEIQAQYDALGGSTHISDEGIAPVTSVIGSNNVNIGSLASGSANVPSFSGAPNFATSSSNTHQSFVQQSFQGNQASASNVSFGVEAPSKKYLPAKKK